MIVGIGIDICEVKRLARARRRAAFARRVFDPQERRDCQGRARPDLHFAARFAAKEACFKALGTGWGSGVGWTDVTVRSNPRGGPDLRIRGGAARRARHMGVSRSCLSLSHGGGYAVAVVVLEGRRAAGAPLRGGGTRPARKPARKTRRRSSRGSGRTR